jgi:hypothetical protein
MAWPYWRARIRACLIDDLRRAHRLWSLWLAIAGVATSVAFAAVQPGLPAHWGSCTLFLAIIVARLLHQREHHDG